MLKIVNVFRSSLFSNAIKANVISTSYLDFGNHHASDNAALRQAAKHSPEVNGKYQTPYTNLI